MCLYTLDFDNIIFSNHFINQQIFVSDQLQIYLSHIFIVLKITIRNSQQILNKLSMLYVNKPVYKQLITKIN